MLVLVSGASSEPNLCGTLLAHVRELTVQTDVRIYGQNMFGTKCEILPPPRMGPSAAVWMLIALNITLMINQV